MEKINLPDNAKRSVFSTVYLIEKLIVELENELLHSREKVMVKVRNENEPTDLQHYIEIFREIKIQIRYLSDKYELRSTHFNLSQVINSKKAKMWEVLCDSKSMKLKGFGQFPPEYVLEFDSDIEKLLKLTERI